MSDNRGKQAQDLSNIRQGDDNNTLLNNGLNNTAPSDFVQPGVDQNPFIDSRNQGDHGASGRFHPFGGLPPNDPGFTRQMGPIMGGKHVDDAAVQTDMTASTLGQKRDDEPQGDGFGVDPSQGKMKMD